MVGLAGSGFTVTVEVEAEMRQPLIVAVPVKPVSNVKGTETGLPVPVIDPTLLAHEKDEGLLLSITELTILSI
jgi:hypothetical protein